MRVLRPMILMTTGLAWGCTVQDSGSLESPIDLPGDFAFEITATGRARVVAGGLNADLSHVGLTLADGADTSELRFSRWGRGSELTAVGEVSPIPCSAPCTDRMEYVYPGVTEWWTPHDNGIEQGWDLSARPPGSEPLTLQIDVTERVDVTSQRVEFGTWKVDSLHAWDSLDTPLDIWMERTESGFAIRVDDAGAAYPVHIDPLVSLADTLVLSKPSGASTSFGIDLAGGGDVNGDGIDDVVVTDSRFDTAVTGGVNGRAWVYFGGAGGALGATLDSPSSNAQSFGTCSLIVDINGDGRSDVLIAEPANLGVDERLYWFLGGSGSFDTGIDGFVDIPRGTDCGMVELNANGDAYMDVAIRVGDEHRIYHGSSSGLVATPFAHSSFNSDTRKPGAADYNGDGYDDIFIGWTDDGSFGSVVSYLGGPSGVTGDPGTGASFSHGGPAGFGSAFARVSANRILITNDTGGRFFGLSDSTLPSPVGRVEDTIAPQWGSLAGPIGDMDGDGLIDFYIGSLNGSSLLKVYPSSNELGVADTQTYQCDNAVSTAGDFNNDGLDDLVCQLDAQVRVYFAVDCVDSDGDGACSDVDCDDADNRRFPGNPEVCDGVDNDCVGGIPLDERDVDSDGVRTCAGDCNDNDNRQYPGNAEVCDGIDNDCLGGVPSNERDQDNDGSRVCDNDCDDNNNARFPGNPELCDGIDNDCVGGVPSNEADGDNDGVRVCASDCDDTDNRRFPGNTEICDGVDNDCVGGIPSNEVDSDNDGVSTCQGDCDDADNRRFPGNTEVCDGVDNDCVGGIPTNEADGDSDGVSTCAGDCDDANPTRFPGNGEVCDGIDNDCVGGVPANELDGDNDGVRVCQGDCDDTDNTRFAGNIELCDGIDNDCVGGVPANELDGDNDLFRVCANDCNDADPAINPAATEVCNGGIDDDCDPSTLEGEDVDGDGFDTCTDCDDTLNTVFPGAPELCDGLDNDCDEDVPANEDDADEDGFRVCDDDCDDALASVFPGAPELCDGIDNDCVDGVPINESDADTDGYRICDGDCNDADPAINPAATEVCNGGIDDDCDPSTLEGEDADDDGFDTCTDCDDTLNTVFPGAPELCDGLDNDCDEDVPANEDDADEDGFRICDDDCDDALASVFPGAPELCDGIDNDCVDGVPVNESDADTDGYRICDGDCDDAVDTTNPGAPELCNGVDDDCDPETPEGEDADSDGFDVCTDCDDSDAQIYPDAPVDCVLLDVDVDCDGVVSDAESDVDEDGVCDDLDLCEGDDATGDADADGFCADVDCDDADDTVFPGAPELCDGKDNACIGEVPDEDADVDGDGVSICGGDCDDTTADVAPGEEEICGDGIDNDCEGGDLECEEPFVDDQGGCRCGSAPPTPVWGWLLLVIAGVSLRRRTV